MTKKDNRKSVVMPSNVSETNLFFNQSQTKATLKNHLVEQRIALSFQKEISKKVISIENILW